jgi:uncharacterized protein (DUF1697 family)
MDELRRLFQELGFSGVETFIASGNVIFEAPSRSAAALERAIERGLEEALGYEVATFIRSPAELAAVGRFRPFPEKGARDATLWVGFLSERPDAKAVRNLQALPSEVDDFRVRGRELYWRIRGGFSDSKLSGAKLEKLLGVRATFRNVTTVTKLAAKYT